MNTYREPISASEHLACPRCGNGEFLLRPDGKIICADTDCYAYAMLRWVTHEASLMTADLALEKVLASPSLAADLADALGITLDQLRGTANRRQPTGNG